MLKLWQQVVLIHHTEHRNERNAQAMATSCTDLSYRMQKNERNAQAMATSCTDPSYRTQEMKGMLKLLQQVILIQHTEDRSKLLILIVEDGQDKLILQR